MIQWINSETRQASRERLEYWDFYVSFLREASPTNEDNFVGGKLQNKTSVVKNTDEPTMMIEDPHYFFLTQKNKSRTALYIHIKHHEPFSSIQIRSAEIGSWFSFDWAAKPGLWSEKLLNR
mgnify:CR=1 FL=1